MQKLKTSIFFLFMATIALFTFCDKKKNPAVAVTPVPLTTSTSTPPSRTPLNPVFVADTNIIVTGSNPNIGQTVTGTATLTNPSTQNSSLQVGNAGWSNPSCISTSSVTLKGINGPIEVTISFLFPPTSGTYAIAANPSPQACSMTVLNAPNQPAGIMWYGKTGQVVVTTSGSGIYASFSGVICTQQNFNFPTVGVSGTIGCF